MGQENSMFIKCEAKNWNLVRVESKKDGAEHGPGKTLIKGHKTSESLFYRNLHS